MKMALIKITFMVGGGLMVAAVQAAQDHHGWLAATDVIIGVIDVVMADRAFRKVVG